MRKVTYRPELVDNDIVLSVRHLKQFFKFGHGSSAFKTKAVHDISFDIKKGECFGLVGESGCGKTTTGRSLIRLYNVTSGSVYFKGYRIMAGKRWNEKEIKWSRIRTKNRLKELHQLEKEEIEFASYSDEFISKFRELSRTLGTLKLNVTNLKKNHEEALKQIDSIDDIDEKNAAIQKENADFESNFIDLTNQIESVKQKKDILSDDAKNGKYNLNLSAEELEKKISTIKESYNKQYVDVKEYLELTVSEQKEAIKQIKFDNRHVDKKLMSKMQMIFQDPVDSLDPRMTVSDIIQEGLKIQGQHNPYSNARKVSEVLEKVGLIPEYASRYPHEFSGGQRQRIGIARALVMNPEFLICDEPISALDVSIRAQIINLLKDLKDEMGLTIMFIAHDLSVVKYFCDRIAVMYFGEMVELATSDELFKHPLHPYTNALLSAIPKPDPLTEKTRKRIIYHPELEHDYSKEKPVLTEITKGHWVLANSEEIKKYKAKIRQLDKAKK